MIAKQIDNTKVSSKVVEERVEFFKEQGYVIMEDCLPLDFITTVREEFLKRMNKKILDSSIKPIRTQRDRHLRNDGVLIDFQPEGGNHDLNRWNMHLPTEPIFINELLLANPHVLSVLDQLLGKDYVAFLIASDTPYPGSGFQNIHQDFPRFGVTVNIPLVDFTDENAPLEIWPGSHVRDSNKGSSFYTKNVSLSKKEMNDVNENIPSERVHIKAGSILIRDQRLVHRGTANVSNEPRPCLAIWYKRIDTLSLSSLTIPVPHRGISNRVARYALSLRRSGRGRDGVIRNKKLLNLGNFLGRLVDEFSASDRDYRRVIPKSLWATFSPRMKHLLRYASVEDHTPDPCFKQAKRSLVGSFILTFLTFGFVVASVCFRVKTPSVKKPEMNLETKLT